MLYFRGKVVPELYAGTPELPYRQPDDEIMI